MRPATPDLAVLASFSGQGGVERMLVNLLNAFAGRGHRIHLVLIRSSSRHLQHLAPSIRTIDLGSRHTATSLWPLMRYLWRYRPPRLLVAKDRAGRLAVLARLLSGVHTRILLRLGTNLSAALAQRSRLQRWLRRTPIRLLYSHIDQIIAVSEGVRQDTLAVSGIDPARISVIRNPVVTAQLYELAQQPPPHPWFTQPHPPIILGAGRLTRQKDFPTLIRSFARLRETHDCRLIILGDGREAAELRGLAAQLGVAGDLDLPGFTDNPYSYMAHAQLFVLSSRWEGSPNVLTEAMALGTPVVATDCPSGPAEILQGGRYAPLVSMGDWQALANAMAQMLDSPPTRDSLREAVREYAVETSASHYLKLLGLEPD